ncbi:related to endoglucanase IV precursor [Cephalotrichum gorgonifer]|uniref:lytic cellulose monooxygenase (C4-dehydrogenating) n=1 Tax=Cephalotrichum gorgonifer TaxID=2041049 RepID=A0AAE8N1Y7_9PEZI|nr:related to endoglucanase IV precursor [Cephalotrichum gorgonifer]
MVLIRAVPVGLVGVLLFAFRAHAHGIADGLAVYPKGGSGGTYYKGYNPSMQFQSPPPDVVGWSTPDDLQNTFVAPSAFSSPDIICHLGATPAALAVPVTAGDDIGIHWDTWPDSHKGPIIDSLANCHGPCQDVDKTKLKFFEIGREAVINAASDLWAPNVLIQNGLTWFVHIPEGIEPGNYVLRHEIIALHAAGGVGGAQNYPFCFTLAVTSAGSDSPEGLGVQEYYDEAEVGIVWDLFGKSPADYVIPGPANNLYSGAVAASQRKPSITATGTGIVTLDVAALPEKTPTETEEPAAEETTAEEATTEEPVEVPSPTEAPEAEATTVDEPRETSSAAEGKEAMETPPAAPEETSKAVGGDIGAGLVVYSTIYVTTRVTVTEHNTTTLYATVTTARP